MHVDAESPGFRKFIENAEKELNLEIETIACPADADVRQAKISTILEAGDSSIDIFSVNDEMISEFKYKDYLKPLNDTVMTKELLSSYPESYMQNVPMKDGKVYSVPYLMDIMVFWVNREVTGDREIRTQEDFAAFLKENLGNDVYGYGGAWDQSYVYNELSEFVNLFGGDYYDWENKNTREALSFLHDLTANGEVSIDTAVIYNAGLCAQQAEEYADAEKFLKESIKLNYEPAQSYAMLSNVLKQQGKTDEALEYLHKGYEQYPDNAYMLVELINHYLLGGEPEKAEVYLDAAIKQDPKNASFYRAKGTLYEKTERPAQAEEMYVKALELDPKDFLAQYNLGNIKLTEAINFHKKVQDIVDVNEYNKELEKVYIAYESVIPYFEKALELSPDEKNTLVTLRELYFKLRNQKPEYQQRYDEIKQKLEAQ